MILRQMGKGLCWRPAEPFDEFSGPVDATVEVAEFYRRVRFAVEQERKAAQWAAKCRRQRDQAMRVAQIRMADEFWVID